ncbi:MAG: hypothetical protein Q3W85_01230, partial [Oscillospiraceae bacterium]|nr:hypothetical protein [Oscillospiraceae bacterium]
MRRRAGIVLALLLVLTGCTPAEPAGPAAEPAAEPVYMALTFDDGPSPSNTPRLLEGLSRRGVRATLLDERSRITFVMPGETRRYPRNEYFYLSVFPMEGRAE